MNCPYCHSIIDDDSRWCDQCGKALMFCPSCQVPRKGTSCPRCGELLLSAEDYFASLGKAQATEQRDIPLQEAPASPASTPVFVLSGESGTLTICEGDFGRKGGIFPELASCPYVSGSHGKLKFFPDKSCWGICDNGSTNGTFINGTRLEKSKWYKLKEGDRLRIATLEFTFKTIKP